MTRIGPGISDPPLNKPKLSWLSPSTELEGREVWLRLAFGQSEVWRLLNRLF